MIIIIHIKFSHQNIGGKISWETNMNEFFGNNEKVLKLSFTSKITHLNDGTQNI
jgi:hypothetical protein